MQLNFIVALFYLRYKHCTNSKLFIESKFLSILIVRSLKPENILIDADGFALLTDFGLSKENISASKRAKSLCGTAEYLSPEVLEMDRNYGKETDWWSFGCVIYEMLTGHPPFYSTDRRKMFEDIRKC